MNTRWIFVYTHLTWYGYDINSNILIDSFKLPSPITPPDPYDELARGIAFSPDGNTVYVGLFGPLYDRIYRFSKFVPVELTPHLLLMSKNQLYICNG